jgi:hypothetical protein
MIEPRHNGIDPPAVPLLSPSSRTSNDHLTAVLYGNKNQEGVNSSINQEYRKAKYFVPGSPPGSKMI